MILSPIQIVNVVKNIEIFQKASILSERSESKDENFTEIGNAYEMRRVFNEETLSHDFSSLS